jgi:hypothetical protein
VSGKFRFDIPDQRRAAPRPPRLRQRQPIPERPRPVPNPQMWDWAPEREIVIGQPRSRRRKAQDDRQ